MLAARVSNPGSGDERWLGELIEMINRITHELQGPIRRIGSVPYPEEDDVKQALDLVTQLSSLIREQIMPRRLKLSQAASALGAASNLTTALDELNRSSQEAVSAMSVYSDTIGREKQQRANERRANKRYATDQRSLQDERFKAADEVSNLLVASECFVDFISQ